MATFYGKLERMAQFGNSWGWGDIGSGWFGSALERDLDSIMLVYGSIGGRGWDLMGGVLLCSIYLCYTCCELRLWRRVWNRWMSFVGYFGCFDIYSR